MKRALVFVPLLALGACMDAHQPMQMSAVGGDRAQGVMQMSVTYSPTHQVLNWHATQHEASRRCNAWGYGPALPFDDLSQICNSRDHSGQCTSITASRTYQCSVRR